MISVLFFRRQDHLRLIGEKRNIIHKLFTGCKPLIYKDFLQL